MDKMRKRTFSISHITLDNLKEMSSFFKINVATLSRMAVYYGIKILESNYVPVRNKGKKIKRKVEIILPEETWAEFSKAMDILKYRSEEYIPEGEMIEIFLNIELRKFLDFYNEYEKKAEESIKYEYNETKEISVNVEMPILLYKKLEDECNKVKIKRTQLGKYLMLNSSIQEYFSIKYDTLDTDVDLLNEIKFLGLNRQKTLTLLRYLIANKRIVWQTRE